MEGFYRQNQLITQINRHVNQFEYEKAIETLTILKKDFPREWISQLKIREFLISKTPHNNYDDFIKTVLLIDILGKKFLDYIFEVKIINSIYANKQVIDEKEIITSTNIVKSYFTALPYIIINAKEKSKEEPQILNYNMTQMFRLFRLIFDSHNLAEKSNYKQIKSNILFGRKALNKYFDYLQMISFWSNFEVVYDYWRKDTYSFSLPRPKKINGKVINLSKIENLLFNELDTVHSATNRAVFCRFNKSKKYKKIMPLKAFLSREESAIANYIFSLYYLEDNVSIGGILLTEWIRAYYLLFSISKIRQCLSYLFPINKSVLIRSERWWINLFVLFGISKKSTENLMKLMKYNKNSSDFYDYPFIETYKKRIVLITCAFRWAQVEYAIESRLNRDGAEPRISGMQFEKKVINLLNSYGVLARPFMQKKNIQCDVAFSLGNDVFICECKSRGRYRKDAGIKDIESSDIKQINRIAAYYRNQKKFILNGLNLVKIDNFYKVVIYSETLNKSIVHDNVIFIDYRMLHSFLVEYKGRYNSLSFKKFLKKYDLTTDINLKINYDSITYKDNDCEIILEIPDTKQIH